MQVWDTYGGKIQFDAPKDSSLGYMVENTLLTNSLHTSIHARGVTVYQTEALSLARSEMANEYPVVQLRSGKPGTVTGRLVVGADGGKSVIKANISPATVGWSYSQLGVVATIVHPLGIKNRTAWQRFLSTGPIALLPLHDNYSSIVWSTNVPHAEYLVALDDKQFIKEVRNAFSAPSTPSLFGQYFSPPPTVPEIETVIGKRGAFPLRFEHAQKYVGNRVALVGDAAHTIHPLAGQGLNLGLADAAAFASVVLEAAKSGLDIGSSVVLEAYDRKQEASNRTSMIALDLVKGTFALSPLLSRVRAAAMNTLNNLSPAKKLMLDWAAGGNINSQHTQRTNVTI
jgi:ubiquinone biosynthesis UbiH/UbiF/VisC/COQ6 family hydroxylase